MRYCKLSALPLAMLCFVFFNVTSLATNLKTDPAVERYLESDEGIPKFIAGKLAAPVAKGLELQATYDFLKENAAQFKMTDPVQELVIKRAESDRQGKQHIRFDQYYHGVRVWGAQLVSHFDENGGLYALNGDYYAGIKTATTPVSSDIQAEQTARADLEARLAGSTLTESELVLFRWEEVDYLAWRLVLFSEFPMGRWEYFVDAATGEIIFKANRLMSDSDEIGTGTGVLGHPRNHIDTRLISGVYNMIDYTRQANNDIHGHGGLMPDGRYIRTMIAPYNLPGNTATDNDTVWSDASQASAVDGQFYTALVYDWFLSELGRNSYDNAGASLNVSVGYGAEGDNNAYWNGSRIVVWTASAGYNELAGSPDVIAHEWGHAVTEHCSNLVYQKEAGALNESFSDMMGAAFEFAHDSLDSPDWYMGENIRSGSTGFRSMSNPVSKGDPDTYRGQYWVNVDGCSPSNGNDWCGVHTNSGVGNKWFYLISDGDTHNGVVVDSIGVLNAIDIAYQANRYYWTYNATYLDAAYGTVLAAKDLDSTGVWAASVEAAWDAVNVIIPGNEISFSYPVGIPTSLEYNQPTEIQFRVNSVFHGVPVRNSGHLHYSIDDGPEVDVPLTEYSYNRYITDLPALDCGSRIKFYFSAEEAANGIFYDPDPSAPFEAVPATDTTFLVNWDLSYQPGFATEGDWEYGRPNGGGGFEGVPDPSGAHTGGNIYGYNLGGDYVNNMAAAHLVSAPIDCSANSDVLLTFYRWLGVDSQTNDYAAVSVSNDSLNWTTLWENQTRISDTSWVLMELDISDVADYQPTVYLRWTLGPTNSSWRSCGWNIDDIQIVSRTCTPWACGDLTGDLKVNLADITRLIDHVYLSKSPLSYERAGNVDGSSEGKINLADITLIIDHVYISGSSFYCP